MNNTKILVIAGTFTATPDENGNYGRPSSVAAKIVDEIKNYGAEKNPNDLDINDIAFVNGGNFAKLENIMNGNDDIKLENYGVTFWFPNIPDNNLPKFRDVKSVNPRTMLVMSKRNDDNKYTFQQIIHRALTQKANLVMEFSKQTLGLKTYMAENLHAYGDLSHERAEKIADKVANAPIFKIAVYDPLGCVYADTTDIHTAVYALLDRLRYIKSVTRQSTVQCNDEKNTVFENYFGKNGEFAENEKKFVSMVRDYAAEFQRLMPAVKNPQRFIGNASFRKIPVWRCTKGMPSFRHGDYIFVSRRNIDKQFIELDNFVPVYLDDDGTLYYSGDEKPSVDTPVQVRLYKALPNINYMLHSHCYLKNTAFTENPIPCGAIEEVNEVLSFIDKTYGDRSLNFYAVNLIGHGSIIMANSLDDFKNTIEYTTRNLPEKMF